MSYIIIGILNLMALLWLYFSSKHVRGLKGEYGKGIWLHSSGYLMRAEENLRSAKISFALVIFLDSALFLA